MFTVAPSSANLKDISLPIPLPAPVTSTTSLRTSFFCTGVNVLNTDTMVIHSAFSALEKNSVSRDAKPGRVVAILILHELDVVNLELR